MALPPLVAWNLYSWGAVAIGDLLLVCICWHCFQYVVVVIIIVHAMWNLQWRGRRRWEGGGGLGNTSFSFSYSGWGVASIFCSFFKCEQHFWYSDGERQQTQGSIQVANILATPLGVASGLASLRGGGRKAGRVWQNSKLEAITCRDLWILMSKKLIDWMPLTILFTFVASLRIEIRWMPGSTAPPRLSSHVTAMVRS